MGEIRVMLGKPDKPLSRQRAYTITRSKGFPEPIAKLMQGPVWLRSDVETWIKHSRPHQATG